MRVDPQGPGHGSGQLPGVPGGQRHHGDADGGRGQGLGDQPGLPDAAGSDDRDQPLPVEQPVEPCAFVPPADERRPRRHRPARVGRPRVPPGHGLERLVQLHTGRFTEVVGHPLAQLFVAGHGVGGHAEVVQRPHGVAAGPLPEGFGGEQIEQPLGRVGHLPGLQLPCGQVLHRTGPQLSQPDGLRVVGPGPPEIGQRVAPPQGQRAVQCGDRLRCRAPARGLDHVLEPHGVDPVGRQVQHAPGRRPADLGLRGEQGAEFADPGVQRVQGPRRPLRGRPGRLHQGVRGDALVGVDEQGGQHRPQRPVGQRLVRRAPVDLEWTENPYEEVVRALAHTAMVGPYRVVLHSENGRTG